MICYFWHLGWRGCRWRMDGQPDRAHLIPKQRLKQAGIVDYKRLWDDRVWVHACRHHHELFDGRFLRLEREQYPSKVFEYADEVGFDFIDPRTGWVQVHREAA